MDIVKEGEYFRFPLIEYELKQPGVTPPYIRPTKRTLAREIGPQAERYLPQTGGDKNSTSGPNFHAEDSIRNLDDESQGVHDFWTMTKECVIRHHHRLRMTMYIPASDDFPHTEVDLEESALRYISDIWLDQGERMLDAPWVGKTGFTILRPGLEPGWVWAGGRPMRERTTSTSV